MPSHVLRWSSNRIDRHGKVTMALPEKWRLVVDRMSVAKAPLELRDLVGMGVSKMTVSRMLKEGVIESPGHGLYALPGGSNSVYADWALVALRAPKAVVCLLSAATFYGMTQELPHRLSIALPHGARLSMGRSFSLEMDILTWRSEALFSLGVDVHRIDGVDVSVTSPERTLVDLFRYSSLNPSMRSSAVRVTDEMFLDSLDRCHSALDRFSFESVSAIARELGCYEALRPFTKTMRFKRADQPFL